MNNFEILCVTMQQKNFSKIKQMNINSNVIFSNQADKTNYTEMSFNNHSAKMITTETKGVGKNRNLGLMLADAELCLFSDDDVTYVDELEQIIINEFKNLPNADIIIFNFTCSDKIRKQKMYSKTRKRRFLEPMPWGCFRVAFRLESVKKANIWFTTLFGGGCVFPSGEDSMWLKDALKSGLKIYISKEVIGNVSFETSTWFTGFDARHFYGKGAFYQATHRRTCTMWMIYFVLRTMKKSEMTMIEKWKWLNYGRKGYKLNVSYDAYNTHMSRKGVLK